VFFLRKAKNIITIRDPRAHPVEKSFSPSKPEETGGPRNWFFSKSWKDFSIEEEKILKKLSNHSW
jgi:hypothetical protein